jgi:hypothetical protein
MATPSITQTVTDLFEILDPLSTDDRQRAIKAVFALLGDAPPVAVASSPLVTQPRTDGGGNQPALSGLGPRAAMWAAQHRLDREVLERVFYFHDGKVDIHVTSVPGSSRREKTINCYLLVGARALLASDAPRFDDHEAIMLCKHTTAYDKNNHPTYRGALGPRATGSRQDGFDLTGPGLKEAGELVASIARGRE